MAVKDETKRPLPKKPERVGPSEADKLNPLAFLGTMASWMFLLLGQRVLDTEEGLAKLLTGLAILGLVVCFGQRLWAASVASSDRRSASQAIALLSGLGLVGVALYFANTEWGRGVLAIEAPEPGKPDNFGDITTAAYVTFMSVSILPSIFGEMARRSMVRAERMESRRVIAAVVSGVAVALAATYGSLFTYVGGKLDVFADFSYFRVAAPSDSTVRMLESLEEPLRVLVFFPPSDEVGMKVNRYLEDLRARTAKLEIEQRDTLKDPGLAKEYKVREEGSVVLVREKMSEILKIGVDEKRAAKKLKTLDGEFQTVLIKTLRDKRTAYLTVGHGEINEEELSQKDGRSAKAVRQLLEQQHYGIKNLGLAQGLGNEIPADASIVFVLGPQKPFSAEEVDTLRRYAEGGGKLFLALDPDAKVDLGPLADIVGLTWDPNLVLHDTVLLRATHTEADKKIHVAKRFSSHPAVSTLGKNVARGANVVVFGGSALDKAPDGDGFQIDFAIKSVPGSYIDVDNNWRFDQGTEKRDTFNLAAAVTRKIDPTKDDAKKKDAAGPADDEMRAWVMGDAEAFSDLVILQLQQNQILFAEVVRWLGGEESFTGTMSDEEDVAIVHTKAEDQVWFYTAIVGVPGLIAGGGVFFTRRRRKKTTKVVRTPAEERGRRAREKRGAEEGAAATPADTDVGAEDDAEEEGDEADTREPDEGEDEAARADDGEDAEPAPVATPKKQRKKVRKKKSARSDDEGDAS